MAKPGHRLAVHDCRAVPLQNDSFAESLRQNANGYATCLKSCGHRLAVDSASVAGDNGQAIFGGAATKLARELQPSSGGVARADDADGVAIYELPNPAP